jgi:dephospho-CoA kinase
MSENDVVRLPEVVVFAGPNGSGKSTITRMAKVGGAYINADDIKRTTLMYKIIQGMLLQEVVRKNCPTTSITIICPESL